MTFGSNPLVNVTRPSSRPIRNNPSSAFEYRNLSVAGFAPSAHILTRTTSVGFPMRPAMPPAAPAQKIVQGIESFSDPVYCFAE